MVFISVTRLRIRSVRFLPLFAVHALRSVRQVKHAPGFKGGSLLPDRRWTFWTMTLWDDQQSMRRYMMEGSHRTAMRHLMHWCDEASVVHWEQAEAGQPGWDQADRRMRAEGRASKVRFPSEHHASMSYAPPRLTGAGPIKPANVQTVQMVRTD
jgi:heme-degrading monooxygenase HmoA